jgi:hypothetical protein
MDKSAIDIAKTFARLSELTIFELRGEWRRLHRMPPPMRLSRDLLIRGVTYKLQEKGIRQPFRGHRTEAGAGQRRAAEPRGQNGRTHGAQPVSSSEIIVAVTDL